MSKQFRELSKKDVWENEQDMEDVDNNIIFK